MHRLTHHSKISKIGSCRPQETLACSGLKYQHAVIICRCGWLEWPLSTHVNGMNSAEEMDYLALIRYTFYIPIRQSASMDHPDLLYAHSRLLSMWISLWGLFGSNVASLLELTCFIRNSFVFCLGTLRSLRFNLKPAIWSVWLLRVPFVSSGFALPGPTRKEAYPVEDDGGIPRGKYAFSTGEVRALYSLCRMNTIVSRACIEIKERSDLYNQYMTVGASNKLVVSSRLFEKPCHFEVKCLHGGVQVGK